MTDTNDLVASTVVAQPTVNTRLTFSYNLQKRNKLKKHFKKNTKMMRDFKK